jgi:hypothetical protein
MGYLWCPYGQGYEPSQGPPVRLAEAVGTYDAGDHTHAFYLL